MSDQYRVSRPQWGGRRIRVLRRYLEVTPRQLVAGRRVSKIK